MPSTVDGTAGSVITNSENISGKSHRGREISSTKWDLEVRVTPGEKRQRMGRQGCSLENTHIPIKENFIKKRMEGEKIKGIFQEQ